MWPSSRRTTAAFVTVVLSLVIVTWGTVGVASGQSDDAYGVRQGGECFATTPLSGDEPVKQFYGYHSTIDNDSSAVGVSPSFSSEGTFDLQRAETSLLFLYAAPGGNLSLVVIHGARQEGEDGGVASFDVAGLPEDGEWVVKDDEYDSPNNTDRWNHSGTTAEIDWAWSRAATDGGAFAGLGDEFEVTVAPGFNGEAELFGADNWGVVEDWQLLSGNRSDPERVPLDMGENVTISSEPCGETGGTPEDGDESADVDDDSNEEEDDDDGDGVDGGDDRDGDDGNDDGPPGDGERGDGGADRGDDGGEPNREDGDDRENDRDDAEESRGSGSGDDDGDDDELPFGDDDVDADDDSDDDSDENDDDENDDENDDE